MNIKWTVRRIFNDLLNTMGYTLSSPTELPRGKGRHYVLSKQFKNMDSVFDVELWVFPHEFPRVASSATGHKEIIVSSKKKWIRYAMNAVQPVFEVTMDETLEDILDSMSETDFAMGPEDIASFESPEPSPAVEISDDESKGPPMIEIPDDESSQDSQASMDY
jgi:hypothetical protein